MDGKRRDSELIIGILGARAGENSGGDKINEACYFI